MKNMGGFVVKAIRENYQDPVIQTQLKACKQREQKEMFDALASEMLEKKNALLRQAVRANAALLEQASVKIHSHIIRARLESYGSLQDAYRDGEIVAAEINAILAEEYCVDLLAPIYKVYETEKARILDA